MKRLPLFIFFAFLFLTACGPEYSPFYAGQVKRQAEADALAARTLQQSLNQEQARRHAEDLHAFQMQQEQLKAERAQLIELSKAAGRDMWIRWSYFCLTVVTVGAILLIGRTFVNETQQAVVAVRVAVAQRVDINSRLIYQDHQTGLYPLIIEYTGHGRHLLTDPNRKVTMELDTRNEGDAQMIAGAIAVQHTYVLASQTRRSDRDTAPSTALTGNPPIVEATAYDVKTVARELFQKKESVER